MLYKMSEWKSANGIDWYCGCTDNLGQNSGAWWLPARILDLAPADYIKFVIDNYKPDKIYYNKEKCFISFSWTNQVKMRLFKNMLNKKAREKNFQI